MASYWVDSMGRAHDGASHTIIPHAETAGRTRIFSKKEAKARGLDWGTAWAPDDAVPDPPAVPAGDPPDPSPPFELTEGGPTVAMGDSLPPPPTAPTQTPGTPATAPPPDPEDVTPTAPPGSPFLEIVPETLEPAGLAGTSCECPHCQSEKRVCPSGHEYYPVSQADAAAVAGLMGGMLAAARSKRAGQKLPLSNVETEVLTEAIAGVMAKRGGVITPYSDLITLGAAVIMVTTNATGVEAAPAEKVAA